MSPRAHLALGLFIDFAGFLFGVVVGYLVLPAPYEPVQWIPWFLVVAASVLIWRNGYRRFVPAVCQSCKKNAAFLNGTRPWRYECAHCGHTLETAISDGGPQVTDTEHVED